jgi:hypothetical protein
VNAVSDAIDTIKDSVLDVIDTTSSIINENNNQQQTSSSNNEENTSACNGTCKVRVQVSSDEVKEFYFDQANGCISKGILDSQVNEYFGSCCDKHSKIVFPLSYTLAYITFYTFTYFLFLV